MLESLLVWWIARLAELLPPGLRADPGLPPDALLLRVDAAGRITRARRVGGIETALAEDAGAAQGLPQVLGLPEGFLLERRVELPLAVARDAARVVALDFDRLTPFAASAAIWGLVPAGEDKARGMALFSLGLVPKDRIAPWLALLREQGLHPAALECARPGGPRRLVLAGAGPRDRRGILAGAGLALLAAIAVALPFIRQQIALDRIEARVTAASDQAALAGQLLRRLAPGQSADDPLLAARAQTPIALQTLAAVTAALPDDTDLVALSLQDGHLSMEGTSASAARLIGFLAAQSTIQDPSFSSPVTRTADGKDAFTLTAMVAGAAGTGAADQAAGTAP